MYSTDNGPHRNTWPDGGMTPFRSEKNTNWEGAFRVPLLVRWPGKIEAGSVANEIVQHHDWLPTFLAMAGAPDVVEKLKKGYKAIGRTYKNHIDGFNLLPYLTGKERRARATSSSISATMATCSASAIDNWKIVFMEQRLHGTMEVWAEPFVRLRLPKIFNLRTDPYEFADVTSNSYWDWMIHNAYFIYVAQAAAAKFAETFKEFPPVQKPTASPSTTRWRRCPRAASGARPAESSMRARFVRRDRPPVPPAGAARVERSRGQPGGDPLPSWNDGASKKAILDFVDARRRKRTDFVPVAQRIAIFDNDGTLWAEQPVYFQLAFALDRVKALAPQHPEWKDKQPFKGVLEGDMKAVAATGEHGLLEIIAATHAGHHDRRVRAIVTDWVASAKHPKTGGHTPRWSISRCWSSSRICARTASRPTSSRAAASSSCVRGSSASTAFRPSRWLAAARR